MLTSEQLDEVSAVKKGGFIDNIGQRARKKMHEQFIEIVRPESDSILDVGASARPAFKCSNYLEFIYPELNITALGLGDQNEMWEKLYPNIPYINGNALALPFEDKSFDIVYSHAVIEHVGSFENQTKMIYEAIRVARKAVWITTPYRWHPIEFHTILPMIHWLPKQVHRFLLKISKKRKYFASEDTLNLLDIKCFMKALRIAETIQAASGNTIWVTKSKIHVSKFMGFTGNLLLHVEIL